MPEEMRDVKEGEMARVWSISSRIGLTVDGKASNQGSSMPTRWTPWPGKKRAVLGRDGRDVYVLVNVCVGVCVDVCVLDLPPLEAWKRRPPAVTLIMIVLSTRELCMLLCPGASPSGVGMDGRGASDHVVNDATRNWELHVRGQLGRISLTSRGRE